MIKIENKCVDCNKIIRNDSVRCLSCSNKLNCLKSTRMTGKKHTDKTKEKLSEVLSGYGNPRKGKHNTNESKEKNRLAHLGRKHSDETKQKLAVALINRLKQNPITIKSKNKLETKLETLLNELFPNEYKFVGDFKIWFDNFNPDFINVNGQKKIIELFGEHWHLNTQARDTKRLETYKKYGYDTLVIWQKELSDSSSLINRLKEFHKCP